MDETKRNDPEEFNFFNELVRKTVHLSVWIIPLAYHWLKLDLWFIQLALAGSLFILIPLEFYRVKINPNSWIQAYVYKYITRASEKEGPANYILTTTIWLVLLLGVGVEFAGETWNGFYSMEIAELVLVTTVMGDSAAALMGKAVGRMRLPLTKNKTVEGFMGGMITCYLIGFVFLSLVSLPPILLPLIPTIVWCCFDFFEDLPWYLADNLFSPTIAAVIIAVLEIIL
ncbi:MAG: diacylglycerol/polyprenol kinase family protein [Candidatus Hodarchaeales archaeon]|jgi:dolichol kinase